MERRTESVMDTGCQRLKGAEGVGAGMAEAVSYPSFSRILLPLSPTLLANSYGKSSFEGHVIVRAHVRKPKLFPLKNRKTERRRQEMQGFKTSLGILRSLFKSKTERNRERLRAQECLLFFQKSCVQSPASTPGSS